MYSSMMQTLDRARKTELLPTFTARIATVRTPTTIAGQTGVPVRGLTFDSAFENGSTRSRAIEKIIRVAAVWIASVQTQTAIATSTRKTRPRVSPSRLVSTYGKPLV